MKYIMKNESYIIELFKTILPYKWSIIFIIIIAVILAKVNLYFTPSIYESHAIIKVKSNNKLVETNDLLRNTINNISSISVKQEILNLKTFKSNKKTLEKINFSVQYFTKHHYKTVELYKNSPIELTLNEKFTLTTLGAMIKVTLKDKGYTLTNEKASKNGNTSIGRASSKVYPFDKEVATPYFTGTLHKIADFSAPLYILLNGNSRQIYENIISSRLKTTQIDKEANLIKISFQDTVPERANDYINFLSENYILQNIKTKENKNQKILTFLDQELKKIKEKLEKSETELERYKSANSVQPSVKSTESFEKLSTLDLDLSELALKEKLAKNLLSFIRNNKNLDAIGPTLSEFKDEATMKFINSLDELQEKADELSIEYTEQYPELIKIRQRIKKIKHKILLNVQNLNNTLKSKRKSLESQKKKYELILKELPKKEKTLIHFQRDYEVNSKMYSYLLEKKSENELIEIASVSNYEIVDKAYNSLIPIKPKRKLVLIIALILGFLIGVSIALLRVFLKTSDEKPQIKEVTSKALAFTTKLPVYGIIPLYEDNMFSTVKLKEAYHQIATNLEFTKKENQGLITLVSSAIEAEGKTTTVVNLAGVFQNLGHKTIVIDFNMRMPSLHSHFGIEQQTSGISTYLSQRDNIGNIIFSSNYDNLDIIPAGPIPPNPSELILSPRLVELFEFLRQRYDYIVLDTTNYTKALESLYLMKFTDKNLIVLREKMSKASAVSDLERIIQEKNLQNIGLVLKSTVKENSEPEDEFLLNSHESSTLHKHTPLQLSL